jgi:isopentenyl-diphosphate delta-isomerase type 1
MAATEQVILVDESDHPLGTAEKLLAHREGLCHRAFSVFVFKDSTKQVLLLQKRAKEKYHSAGLWTNSCCSHPRPGEETVLAAERRLKEELGIQLKLRSVGLFHYIAHFENGLTENEVDHVLIGTINDQPIHPDPLEVEDYQWITVGTLLQELDATPQQFTPWLKQALNIAIS